MTDPVWHTQLVSVVGRLPVPGLRESFSSMGFSIRSYFTDTGGDSRRHFYIDYTSAGRLTLWHLKYGSVYPGVVFADVVYE